MRVGLNVVLGTLTQSDDLTDIETRDYRSDPQRVVVRKGHPLAKRGRASLADLEDFSWVRGPPETYFDRYLEGLYPAEGRTPPETRQDIISAIGQSLDDAHKPSGL